MLHPLYLVPLAVLLLFSIPEYTTVSAGGSKKKFFPIIILVMLTLIFYSTVRLGQGADFWPYVALFKGANEYVPWSGVTTAEVEASYVIISKIIGEAGLPFMWVLFVFITLSLSLKFNVIYKYSPLPVLSVAYFYIASLFFQDMGQMRQGLATSICMFSYKYIKERKLLPFLICMYLSYYTHKTSMIFFPAYWYATIKISPTKAKLIVLASFVLWPLEPYKFLGEFANSVSEDNLASDSFNAYVDAQEDIGLGITDIVKAIFLIIFFINDKYIFNTTKDSNYIPIRNLVIMYYFIYYAFHGNAIFSIRLPGVFEIFTCILVPMLILYSKKSMRMILYIYFFIYIILMGQRIGINGERVGFGEFFFLEEPWSTYVESPEFYPSFFVK